MSTTKGTIPAPKARPQRGGMMSRCMKPATSMAPAIPKIAPEAPAATFSERLIDSAELPTPAATYRKEKRPAP